MRKPDSVIWEIDTKWNGYEMKTEKYLKSDKTNTNLCLV